MEVEVKAEQPVQPFEPSPYRLSIVALAAERVLAGEPVVHSGMQPGQYGVVVACAEGREDLPCSAAHHGVIHRRLRADSRSGSGDVAFAWGGSARELIESGVVRRPLSAHERSR